MELFVSKAQHLARAVELLAVAIDDEDAGVFSEIGYVIGNHCKEIEGKRKQLFRLLHPARDHFEREGWPGDEQPKEAVSA
jgi:hypothetical protein